MRLRSLLFNLGVLAVLVFAPPRLDPPEIRLRLAGLEGDVPCPPDLARLEEPDRTRITPWALLEDAAYAAADAGVEGMIGLLGFIALVPLVLGLWCEGVLCGVRRLATTLALGIPICLGLAYMSCFLEGRVIRVAPEQATEFAATSLHAKTHFTTGLLSPKQLVIWHEKRGFRVLNVSDEDTDLGARAAQRYAEERGLAQKLTVLRGEEWHGEDDQPDLVLVNVRQPWSTKASVAETAAGVRNEGGASFLAFPWAELPRPLDEMLAKREEGGAGIDAVAIVTGVIHGGRHVGEAARRQGTALVGSMDYKFGPHVNVVTLVPLRLAGTPGGVVKALRAGETRVIHAIPGMPVTSAVWEAGRPGVSATVAGLRTLYSTPFPRRVVWFAWLAGVALLWRIATIDRGRSTMRPSVARVVFMICAVATPLTAAGIGWQVREITGPIGVPVLLGVAAFFAIPLLASSEVLARIRRPAGD